MISETFRLGTIMESPEPKNTSLSLAKELEILRVLAAAGQLSIERAVKELGLRCHAILSFVLCIPFMQPIPLAGLSTIIGGLIALLGLAMALGRLPWLPEKMASYEIESSKMEAIAKFGNKVLGKLEKIVKPRYPQVIVWRGTRVISGVGISICAVLLALPLPIPFTNTVPAFSIMLVSLGLLEEDGLMVGLGFFAVFCTIVVFTAIFGLPLLGLWKAVE